jgi:hypothetical protein
LCSDEVVKIGKSPFSDIYLMNSQRFGLWALLSFASVPCIAFLPGCSGGSSGSSGRQSGSLGTTNFEFGNGQTGTLSLIYTGRAASGELAISPANAASTATRPRAGTRNITMLLPSGTFEVSGQYSYSQRFRVVSENLPETGTIWITGVFPSTTREGSYTITAGEEMTSGVLPRLAQPTPTPTATAAP